MGPYKNTLEFLENNDFLFFLIYRPTEYIRCVLYLSASSSYFPSTFFVIFLFPPPWRFSTFSCPFFQELEEPTPRIQPFIFHVPRFHFSRLTRPQRPGRFLRKTAPYLGRQIIREGSRCKHVDNVYIL